MNELNIMYNFLDILIVMWICGIYLTEKNLRDEIISCIGDVCFLKDGQEISRYDIMKKWNTQIGSTMYQEKIVKLL